MPFTLSYTDPRTQAEYPDAFWDFDRFEIQKANKQLTIIYRCYATKAAHDQGSEAITGLERQVVLKDAEYLATMKLAESSNNLVTAIANLIDILALEYKSVETEERQADGRPVKQSFFKNAQRIAPDLTSIKSV